MFEAVVADGGSSVQMGTAISIVLWPAGGVLLLVIGIRRQIARRRWVRWDNQRLLEPEAASATTEPPAEPSGGVLFIIAGTIVLAVGLLQLTAEVIRMLNPGLG